jgi:SAM-dependent methyltransferase
MCGTADGYELLTEHLSSSVDYNGFDLSEAMIERARARHHGVNIWKADVTAFEPSRTYDLVLILGGLHHVPHVAREVVASLSAATRPGGFFLSWEPTHDNIVFRRVRESIYRRNSVFEATSERAFRTSELFSLFEESGFTLVDAMYPGLLSYVLYYNPDAFPRLNLGSPKTVQTLWRLERPFMRSWLARKLSFATLTLWQKRASGAQ